jgi:hypothetical protein
VERAPVGRTRLSLSWSASEHAAEPSQSTPEDRQTEYGDGPSSGAPGRAVGTGGYPPRDSPASRTAGTPSSRHTGVLMLHNPDPGLLSLEAREFGPSEACWVPKLIVRSEQPIP